ncbi:PQQ-dependent sugar dehydrogenase [Hoeflea prorocentri]|uniref:PQQ-dependent sugar dehydrogenase n=1 Tax=Hoeflea prorocentri TaxID=1922333 RepID=A0A9X3ZG99_9HYPH|nr:PQQ-dependent sugar dehydrogenase [Hoeflea prorocentri]MCY6379576.1 PQQ-dependent sugar dehydrogenase [Hoeflea prorocentri]MDA5397376.1 PQQ-dependent sugar dehydrogenase [Hoeflea prorocentri]
MRILTRAGALAAILTVATVPAIADGTYATDKVNIKVETVAEGLEHPWGVETLPDGAFLVTERPGRLRIVENGALSQPLDGLPKIAVGGQGGLLDVALANDFDKSGTIYFTYSEPGRGGAGTALARAKLVRDGGGGRLENVDVIFSMDQKTRRGQHFGSRIAVADDNTVFFSIGDRGDGARSQDLMDHAGAILRVGPDGSIPPDNPFVSDDKARSELWSKGHRNPQGMDFDSKTGTLFAVEHGARGGDEINQPQAGLNYGWPVISYGRHYSGAKIGIGSDAPGYQQPIHYWDPSIAPGGMTVYRGAMFPEWDGDFLVAALKDRMLVRVDRDSTGNITGEENLLEGRYGRMRDVKTAPDGSLLVLTDEPDGALLRISRN